MVLSLKTRWLQNPELPGAPFFWQGGPLGVFLSHGFTATPALMLPLARVLHEHGYTVAGPLLPGHGTTPFELNRCRWQDWVAGAEEVYAQLAAVCSCVFVGGESLGGLLALYLAGLHPEVAGVLAYAPALQLYAPRSAWRVRLLWPWRPLVPKSSRRTGYADARWQGYRVYPLAATRELLRFQRVVRQRLPLVRQPIMVVQGQLDRTVSPTGSLLLQRETRSAAVEVHWLAHSGHCTTIDVEWEQVAALSLAFIARFAGGDVPATGS